MKNNTSFCEEQHVVLESIFCSIGKSPKLGIRCEKLKINSYFCQTQPQDKKKYKFFHRNLWQLLKKLYFCNVHISVEPIFPFKKLFLK